MTDTQSHDFVVTVSGCTPEQAEQVLNERISPEEDYGFDYEVGFKKLRPRPQVLVCKCRAGDVTVKYADGRVVKYVREHKGHVHGAEITDVDTVAPGGVVTREQLEQWVGRTLTDRDVRRIIKAIPNSTVPEAIASIADGLR